VYGFRDLQKDKNIDIPTHSGFYAFLAKESNNELMLNIPETIILNSAGFTYLRNP